MKQSDLHEGNWYAGKTGSPRYLFARKCAGLADGVAARKLEGSL